MRENDEGGGPAFQAVDSGQEGCATSDHGQDGRATSDHGEDGRGTSNHGLEGHATSDDETAALHIRHGAYLPHWTKDHAVYYVTFRLGDSLPKSVLEAWLAEREDIVKTAKQMGRPLSESEEKRLHFLFSSKVDSYLDAGHGACWMKEERIARIVADALRYFDGQRYLLLAWCVMPNHAHVVFQPLPGNALKDILHSWKSFTANEANRALKRKGTFWQPESYDHLIRNQEDLDHSIGYVLDNPEKAGLRSWKWVGQSGHLNRDGEE
ncbi:MAG TPA: transposase [Candidatus Hydrogenedentes bacterium]|nr:transposase [Candidatus Hydrogenedentota bacterium]